MSQVSSNNYPQGIIAKGHIEKDFKFNTLSGSALGTIQAQLPHLPLSQRRSANRALFYFECFLWITHHSPIATVLDLQNCIFRDIQRLFYGALYSNSFLSAEIKYSSRKKIAQCFFKLLNKLSESFPVNVFVYSDITDDQTKQCIIQFEEMYIDPRRVSRLAGWHVVDRNSGSYRLKMRAIFDVLGHDFTTALYQESRRHALTQSHYGNYANIVSRLDDFLYLYDKDSKDRPPLCPELFQEPIFVYQFFWNFQRWHFESYAKRNQNQPKGRVLANLQRQWIRIISWAKNVLINSRLMQPPPGDVWPEGSKKLTRPLYEIGHHRYADGNALVSQKLLTQIPLSASDKEATELLFKKIKGDFNKVVLWARNQIDLINYRLCTVLSACEKGELIKQKVRISSKSFGQPHMVMNCLIKTIVESHRGFIVIDHSMRARLVGATGSSFSTMALAERLVLPTKYMIAPIAIWLVAQHPILTDASLLGCELFDRNGKRSGFVSTDSGSVLVVKKNRKGSQQEVVLSSEAISVVELLIQITTPLRNYLKKKNDDGWRRLFIVAGGQGFQEPYVFTNQISFAKILRQKEFVQAHSAKLGELISTLSLARIRATAGVIVYLNTLSIDKMAESLGNSKRVAMNHYLPPTIMQFFQERWVRIFQNAVIVYAMRDSHFLLKATDFDSMTELNKFLEKYALRALPEVTEPLNHSAEPELGASGSEIIISLDEEILRILISLRLAVENAGPCASGAAIYWSEFIIRVESHIESHNFPDPYLRSCLVKARRGANPQQFESLVYV
ncbi:Uncharacterised protein [Cedecea lapagei]|uniref:Uncharacterized protein n=1 Tax=Cedecea lapagei TaxID=158823 RepID=A0A3S4IHW9_9ENTR|nr:hypothetical protein [Cedecea lapagei]VEB97395.1 Uncharacterised protein [Cedecea lapagei]